MKKIYVIFLISAIIITAALSGCGKQKESASESDTLQSFYSQTNTETDVFEDSDSSENTVGSASKSLTVTAGSSASKSGTAAVESSSDTTSSKAQNQGGASVSASSFVDSSAEQISQIGESQSRESGWTTYY